MEERFWAKVDQNGDCWEWMASRLPRGYGLFTPHGRGSRSYAHRTSWEIHFGPIPAGLWVLHHCDNPSCVRPSHLFLGTRADNMNDAANKSRLVFHNSLKTHCLRGHPFDAANTHRRGTERRCRACAVEATHRYRLRKVG